MTLLKVAAFAVAAALCLPVFANEVNGIMMVVKGDIKVTSAKDKKTEAAKVGKKVFSGDTIVAGADSRAKIVMSDKNVINVSPDSKIIIEKYENNGATKNVELNVVYGKVRASVEQKYDGEKSKFNIKTASAVAGVRGTDFLTGYNPKTKASQIITFSGTVAVGKPGPGGSIVNPVFVQPGQMTNVGAGGAPEAPAAVPKEQLQQMNTETKADTAQGKGTETAPGQAKQEEKKDEKKEERADKQAEKSDKQAEKSPADKQADKNSGDKQADSGSGGSRGPASEGPSGPGMPGVSGDAKSPASDGGPGAPSGGMNAGGAMPPPGPASGSMVDSSVLGPAMGATINFRDTSMPPAAPPPMYIPPPVQVVQPPTNTFINDAIRNTQTRAIISIQKGN